MDPQVASIRRFVVWALIWAVTLTSLAGLYMLFLWKSPAPAAADALPTPAPVSAQVLTQAPVPLAVPTQVTEVVEAQGNTLYFPLIFNLANPPVQAAGQTP
jgi:hypothetical protein